MERGRFHLLISLLGPADEKLMAELGSRYDTASKPLAFTGDRARDDMSVNYIHRALFDYRREQLFPG